MGFDTAMSKLTMSGRPKITCEEGVNNVIYQMDRYEKLGEVYIKVFHTQHPGVVVINMNELIFTFKEIRSKKWKIIK